MKSRKKSEEYFRKEPEFYNCAQSILLGFRQEFNVTDEEIQAFSLYKGGKTPNGDCGALYTANYLLNKQETPKLSRDISQKFLDIVGQRTCHGIKTISKYPCQGCVIAADRLLEEEISKL